MRDWYNGIMSGFHPEDESSILSSRTKFYPIRLVVRMTPSQGVDTSSNLVWDTKQCSIRLMARLSPFQGEEEGSKPS